MKPHALIVGGPLRDRHARAVEEGRAGGAHTFAHVKPATLQLPFELGRMLADRPQVVIVSGVSLNVLRHVLLSLVTHDTMAMHRKGHPPVDIPTPRFILTSGYREAIDVVSGNPRFITIDMDTKQ